MQITTSIVCLKTTLSTVPGSRVISNLAARGHPGTQLTNPTVEGLAAMDDTPVIGIKQVVWEILPRGEMHQIAWISGLMKTYWKDNETK